MSIGSPKKNDVFWANYDASNPVESSGIVGKNFPFDMRIESVHRLEHTYPLRECMFQWFQPFHGIAQD